MPLPPPLVLPLLPVGGGVDCAPALPDEVVLSLRPPLLLLLLPPGPKARNERGDRLRHERAEEPPDKFFAALRGDAADLGDGCCSRMETAGEVAFPAKSGDAVGLNFERLAVSASCRLSLWTRSGGDLAGESRGTPFMDTGMAFLMWPGVPAEPAEIEVVQTASTTRHSTRERPRGGARRRTALKRKKWTTRTEGRRFRSSVSRTNSLLRFFIDRARCARSCERTPWAVCATTIHDADGHRRCA